VGSRDVLELGQQVAHVLGVTSEPAAGVLVRGRGSLARGLVNDGQYSLEPSIVER